MRPVVRMAGEVDAGRVGGGNQAIDEELDSVPAGSLTHRRHVAGGLLAAQGRVAEPERRVCGPRTARVRLMRGVAHTPVGVWAVGLGVVVGQAEAGVLHPTTPGLQSRARDADHLRVVFEAGNVGLGGDGHVARQHVAGLLRAFRIDQRVEQDGAHVEHHMGHAQLRREPQACLGGAEQLLADVHALDCWRAAARRASAGAPFGAPPSQHAGLRPHPPAGTGHRAPPQRQRHGSATAPPRWSPVAAVRCQTPTAPSRTCHRS